MSEWPYLDFLRRTFAESEDGVAFIDGRGFVLYANNCARGWLTEGTRVDETSAFGRAVLPALRSQAHARVEWGEDGPGGVRRWCVCALTPVREEGGPAGSVCLSTDVTELKRNEERLRRSEQLMVDTHGVAHLGTWEWDVSEPHARWSAELYRIYGLTPDTYTPSYEGYLKMVHPDDRQRVIEATDRVFHQHVPYSHDERIFRPDGSMRYLHTWAHPILDDGGRLQRLVGVCQDITDRAEAEEHVRRLNADLERRVAERTRQLEASMRDLEAFNAMVSHDLRAPVSIVELVFTLLARPNASSEDFVKGRERVGRAISQMKSLIDDLLAFAKIGNVELSHERVDVSSLIQEIVTDLRQGEPTRAVDISIETNISCYADRALLRVALQNLIANAWKYTARQPDARIEVSSTSRDGRPVLQVRDNGAGFEMKDAHRLFAPFQRLHTDQEFSGTGVGLASVQRIFERHGCRVWAEGAPGAGATFFVELPDRISERLDERALDAGPRVARATPRPVDTSSDV
jgi:PAS domain S-box-containing protein